MDEKASERVRAGILDALGENATLKVEYSTIDGGFESYGFVPGELRKRDFSYNFHDVAKRTQSRSEFRHTRAIYEGTGSGIVEVRQNLDNLDNIKLLVFPGGRDTPMEFSPDIALVFNQNGIPEVYIKGSSKFVVDYYAFINDIAKGNDIRKAFSEYK